MNLHRDCSHIASSPARSSYSVGLRVVGRQSSVSHRLGEVQACKGGTDLRMFETGEGGGGDHCLSISKSVSKAYYAR